VKDQCKVTSQVFSPLSQRCQLGILGARFCKTGILKKALAPKNSAWHQGQNLAFSGILGKIQQNLKIYVVNLWRKMKFQVIFGLVGNNEK
jgi:hypothetical protein